MERRTKTNAQIERMDMSEVEEALRANLGRRTTRWLGGGPGIFFRPGRGGDRETPNQRQIAPKKSLGSRA